jgi:hypothetical protein
VVNVGSLTCFEKGPAPPLLVVRRTHKIGYNVVGRGLIGDARESFRSVIRSVPDPVLAWNRKIKRATRSIWCRRFCVVKDNHIVVAKLAARRLTRPSRWTQHV